MKKKTIILPPVEMSDGVEKLMEKLAELQKKLNAKRAASKKMYRSSGRGQWSKKVLKNIKESQAAMAIDEQVQLKEHAPLAPMIPKDHLKKCTNILIDGMVKEGAKKMRKLIRATNYKTGQIINLPTINEREAELSNAIKKGYTLTKRFLSPAPKKKERLNVVTDMDFAFGKTALLPYTKEDLLPKKKRIPTCFNAKKLFEKHKELWNSIFKSVRFDIVEQIDCHNRQHFSCWQVPPSPILDNVANNAAFTAIVEMIKRELL